MDTDLNDIVFKVPARASARSAGHLRFGSLLHQDQYGTVQPTLRKSLKEPPTPYPVIYTTSGRNLTFDTATSSGALVAYLTLPDGRRVSRQLRLGMRPEEGWEPSVWPGPEPRLCQPIELLHQADEGENGVAVVASSDGDGAWSLVPCSRLPQNMREMASVK